MFDPNDKIINPICPDAEDEIEESFDDDPYGLNEPDDFGLNNSWDWAGD